MKKLLSNALVFVLVLCALTGCGGTADKPEGGEQQPEGESQQTEGGTIEVDFWSSPEQFNLTFWTNYAEKFNATNTQMDGKTVVVKVQMMPAQPFSEAGLQNAIATKTAPAISENINRNVASIFADAQAIYDLQEEEWFQTAVENRKLENILNGWELDGAQYVMPLYVNPIGYAYNSKALSALDITEVPKTLDDFYALLDAYAASEEALKEEGVTHFFYRDMLLMPGNYWERWFDVQSQYNAFAKGSAMYSQKELTVDKEALTKVYEMYGNMGKSILTGSIENFWQQETVPAVMGIGCPWDVAGNTAADKIYGMDGDYVFGPTFVEKDGDEAYNYGDTKGLVMYKGNGVSEEEHAAANMFMDWVFNGGGKDTFDIDWVITTTMLPVRGDLSENESMAAFFEENPAMREISAFIGSAVPGFVNESEADMLIQLGEQSLAPMVNYVAELDIHTNPDVSAYVDKAVEAMQGAGRFTE